MKSFQKGPRELGNMEKTQERQDPEGKTVPPYFSSYKEESVSPKFSSECFEMEYGFGPEKLSREFTNYLSVQLSDLIDGHRYNSMQIQI